jgi:hypothetical protein
MAALSAVLPFVGIVLEVQTIGAGEGVALVA